MQQIHSNLAKTIQEETDFEDGRGTNSLIQGKNFLLLTYILFSLLYLLVNHPISLDLHDICEKFCCSLKMQNGEP